MTDLSERLERIRVLIDGGAYFTINRARQYGKTTTLAALVNTLADDYLVISLDFQRFSQSCLENERTFCQSFTAVFLEEILRSSSLSPAESPSLQALQDLQNKPHCNLMQLFESLLCFCESSPRPVILIIDEVDHITNNQIFIDFLSQLRNSYLDRELKGRSAFWSVILAGLYDIRNIRQKIRTNEDHRTNSPWNIAADFDVNMSLSQNEIAGMLCEYEKDHHTGMNLQAMAALLYEYTSGYPFLVSRLCKLMDEKLSETKRHWTKDGFYEAVRLLMTEKNSLFDSLTGKLQEYPELDSMLHSMLFTGKSISYNPDDTTMDIAVMLVSSETDRVRLLSPTEFLRQDSIIIIFQPPECRS